MKTELTIDGGELTISTVDGVFSATVDIETGEVISFVYTTATVPQIAAFANKVKTRYSKFLRSKDINDFIN
ncbi:hypothetical protein Goe24_01250 [Bacillus phage vB_BsuM-Goe24]|nr:hypothetical protein BSP14_115 [Bacillus phage BSP14]QDP43150.1 hypothetical protein Goe7_c01250 [Bacillus phage vB_BveM-Goe7]WCS69242.1 hypothetical protein Goe20_01250 [Bacillus phage vB_BsuM-Goe20]WCS69500.1 hypothetical protein Goe24_01250 [Bacillus phage vB_BsuM-Goe24]